MTNIVAIICIAVFFLTEANAQTLPDYEILAGSKWKVNNAPNFSDQYTAVLIDRKSNIIWGCNAFSGATYRVKGSCAKTSGLASNLSISQASLVTAAGSTLGSGVWLVNKQSGTVSFCVVRADDRRLACGDIEKN